MTLKIKSKPPLRKPKRKSEGWHSFDTNELALWAYMWSERKDNARFSEPVRRWALRLHTTPSSLVRWLQALLQAQVILAGKGDVDQDGWKTAAVYVVTEPPTEVLRFAGAWWELEAKRGRSVPISVHGETRINSGDARVPKVEHLTTNNEQHQYKPVSMSVVKKEPLSIDNVGVPKTVHGETRINSGDASVPKVEHDELSRVDAAIATAKVNLATCVEAAKENPGEKQAADAAFKAKADYDALKFRRWELKKGGSNGKS